MNIKLAVLTALLLVPGQAMAEAIRVVCVADHRVTCYDDYQTCFRQPACSTCGRSELVFTVDLTKKPAR
jgi:hypothetical protein